MENKCFKKIEELQEIEQVNYRFRKYWRQKISQILRESGLAIQCLVPGDNILSRRENFQTYSEHFVHLVDVGAPCSYLLILLGGYSSPTEEYPCTGKSGEFCCQGAFSFDGSGSETWGTNLESDQGSFKANAISVIQTYYLC
jgi:hypothetical protein